MMDIVDYKDLIDKCSHCAFCEAVCPVFKEDLLETHVARSRLLIIKESLIDHHLPVTRRVKEIVNRCLLCAQCKNACPAGVPVDDIVIAARYNLYQGKRSPFFKRQIMKHIMAQRGKSDFFRRAGAFATKMGLDMADLPQIKRQSFSDMYQGTYAPKSKRRAKVAYFAGCATNAFYPDTGDAVMKVLSRNGVEITLPEGLVCCGIPALSEGDIETAKEMMKININILSKTDADYIVTDCTSCFMTLKEKSLTIIDGSDAIRQHAETVSLKITDVMSFLNQTGLTDDFPALKETYTYHIPCHARGMADLMTAPVKLLSNVDQARYVILDDDNGCCGAGGMFFTEYKALSGAMRDKKCRAIRQTAATTIVTQCPSCRTYIQAGFGNDKKVTHPMVLLARGYGLYIV
ncbi:MAG: (Fe-S)-binding protein [Proteobacteria bacterium]|nr:(Fe-S)-binding protein [Pseudomonadota bacterium]